MSKDVEAVAQPNAARLTQQSYKAEVDKERIRTIRISYVGRAGRRLAAAIATLAASTSTLMSRDPRLRRVRRIATLSALLAVIPGALSASAFASPTTPFRGEFVATEIRTPDPFCGGLRIEGTGAGTATKMGAATWWHSECVDFLTQPGRALGDGRAVLATLDGDELHLTFEYDGAPPNLPSGDVHVSGPFTITDGTGRFAGATGDGTLTADTSVFRNDVHIRLAGRLSRRAASAQASSRDRARGQEPTDPVVPGVLGAASGR